MKKTYIAPQMEIVGGIYDTYILAGSGGGTEPGFSYGSDGKGGNQESGGTGSSDGGDLGQGAKEHYNAWTVWED